MTTVSTSGLASLKYIACLMLVCAAVAGAVRQVRSGVVALAGALDEHHALTSLPSARLIGAAVRGLRASASRPAWSTTFGLAAAELGQLGHVVGREAGGLDDGADGLRRRCSRFLSDLDGEAARRAGGFGDGRIRDARVMPRMRRSPSRPARRPRVLRLGIAARGTARASQSLAAKPPSAPVFSTRRLRSRPRPLRAPRSCRTCRRRRPGCASVRRRVGVARRALSSS